MPRHDSNKQTDMLRIAILDDYQDVALKSADWSSLSDRATLTVFNDHVSDANEIVDRLTAFDVVCVMRERTPLSRDILARLPQLKLIASTAPRNASIDVAAAADYNIEVMHTRYDSSPTVELTWALILASARNLIIETASVRSGGWQRTVGMEFAARCWEYLASAVSGPKLRALRAPSE
jgi:lactate dehydrogenase-like 2-hydroxyacid dehydrogenase